MIDDSGSGALPCDLSWTVGMIFKYYKRRFRNALEPLFVMLIAKKKVLNKEEWQAMVNRTMHSILNNPTEFLGQNLPESPGQLRDILDDIFNQFLKAKA